MEVYIFNLVVLESRLLVLSFSWKFLSANEFSKTRRISLTLDFSHDVCQMNAATIPSSFQSNYFYKYTGADGT